MKILQLVRSQNNFNGNLKKKGFVFPANWKFVNTAPADLAIGKYAVLTLTSTTAADTGVIAAYAVEA